jgi:hypothetical protein
MLLIYQSCGKSQGIFLFSYDFFLPHARLYADEAHFALSFVRSHLEHAEGDRPKGADGPHLLCVFEDLCAGVVFLLHVYTLPQDGQKARDFFIFLKTFFLDKTLKHPPIFGKNSYERLNVWSLGPIFKTLQLLNLSLFYLSGHH